MYSVGPNLIQSHIRRVPVCLAVTCHLHFWQSEQDRLGATAVTRGWYVERIPKEEHRKLDSGEENHPTAPVETRTRDISITSLVI